MKKFLFAAATLLVAFAAEAQENTHVVKTNPLGFFAGQYQIGYEHRLTDNISVQVVPGIISRSLTLTTTDSTGTTQELGELSSTRGFIVIPEVRYYFGGNACEGLYLGVAGRFRKVSNYSGDEKWRERSANGVAGVLGYQWTNGEGAMVDIFVGPQYKKATENILIDGFEEGESLFGDLGTGGNGVRFGVNVGFGW
jgi:hypothetical protein